MNAVGVDVNTASVPLLSRVSGITGRPRRQHRRAPRRERPVPRPRRRSRTWPRLGPKAFEQCAGFLRIPDGDDPLDASACTPRRTRSCGGSWTATGKRRQGADRQRRGAARAAAGGLRRRHFGLPTVTDILAELEKPGRDPRPAFKTATFEEGVEKIADLKPGMTLEGVVTNVAAFGAFVDVGVHQDGLVHVSAMSHNFVKDPREVVKSGDVVKVKVLEVDLPRKRIALTPAPGRRARRGQAGRPGRRTARRRWSAAGRRPAGRRQSAVRAGSGAAASVRAADRAAAARRAARWRTPSARPASASRRLRRPCAVDEGRDSSTAHRRAAPSSRRGPCRSSPHRSPAAASPSRPRCWRSART